MASPIIISCDTNSNVKIKIYYAETSTTGSTAKINLTIKMVRDQYGPSVGYPRVKGLTVGGVAATMSVGSSTVSVGTSEEIIATGSVSIPRGNGSAALSVSTCGIYSSGAADSNPTQGITSAKSGTVTYTSGSFTLTFNANGGTGAPAAIKAAYGTRIVLNEAATRAHYDFVSWNLNSSGTSTDIKIGEALILQKDTTVYAKWQIQQHEIRYVWGNGAADSVYTKDYGTITSVTTTIPSRSGYNWVGWASTPSATKAEFNAGQQYTLTKDMIFYGIWQPKEFKVLYSNADANLPEAQSKIYNVDLKISSLVPRKNPTQSKVGYITFDWGNGETEVYERFKSTEYTFSKWQDLDGDKYVAGGTYTKNKATTLVATYSLKDTDLPVIPPSATKEGWEFLGWFDAQGNKAPEPLAVGTDTTYYAQWRQSLNCRVKTDEGWREGLMYVKTANGWETGLMFIKNDGWNEV